MNDDKITINNDIVLVGRSDAAWVDSVNRIDVDEILSESDLSKYLIVLDHQAVEDEENAKEDIDLQLSGHTHGGQMFPYGMMYDLTGRLNYGEYEFGDMKQIISIMVKELQNRCREQLKMELNVTSAAKAFIVEKSFERKYGARPLKRKIQEEIEEKNKYDEWYMTHVQGKENAIAES